MSLADVVAMPAIQHGAPRLLSAPDRLQNEVEWVQATEFIDTTPLRAGDLVLTTGIAASEAAPDLVTLARACATAGIAGLMVELGRRWTSVPPALIEACEGHHVPLFELHREVSFAEVSQVICEQLVATHLGELREHRRIDDIFTELSLTEASPEEVMAQVSALTAGPVVLEGDTHEILLFDEGPAGDAAFADNWPWKSLRTKLEGRTSWDASYGWLLTRLGKPERPWGRLILQCSRAPSRRDIMIIERAAAALTMQQVHGADRATHLRRRHREALTTLAAGTSDIGSRRCAMAVGFPAAGRTYTALSIAPAIPPATVSSRAAVLDVITGAVQREAERQGAAALVASFEGHVVALVAVDHSGVADEVVDRVHSAVGARIPVYSGAGVVVANLAQADLSMKEAVLALAEARRAEGTSVQRLGGLRVRGLLGLLHGDERVQAFARRQLAPLTCQSGGPRGHDLLDTLQVLLEEWGSKSAAASRLNISRSVLYERIERIQRRICASLDDPEVRTSLHLALLYSDMTRARSTA